MSAVHQEPIFKYSPLDDEERKKRLSHRRKRPVLSFGLLCRLCGLVALVALAFVAYFGFMVALNVYKHVEFAHHDLIVKDPRVYMLNKERALVRPLLDSSSTFDIRATVWLDVTQHLGQGLKLPSKDLDGRPIQLVRYSTSEGKIRTDAILYSGEVFKDVAWKQTRYASIPLRIPIDPFYTQDIGPSSLRVTYQAVLTPEMEERLTSQARLKQLYSIFPESDLMLPRSTDSRRIHTALPSPDRSVGTFRISNVTSISQALEWTGVNDNLLKIKLSSYQTSVRNCSHRSNLYLAESKAPLFLDNAPSFRNFTTSANIDDDGRRLILGSNCTIWTPHLKMRSSVFMTTHEHSMPSFEYFDRGTKLSNEVQRCFAREGLETNACRLLRSHGPLESMLEFTRSTEEGSSDDEEDLKATRYDDSVFRYAPHLVHRPESAAPMDHYTLPRIRPQSTGDKKEEEAINLAQEDACRLPMLKTDETNEFFQVSLDVRFSFISSLRTLTLDSLNRHERSTVSREVRDGQDIRFFTSPDQYSSWQAHGIFIGDGHHPQSRAETKLIFSISSAIISFTTSALTFLYWYTRTGTEGLSKMAIRMTMLSQVIGMAAFASRAFEGEAGVSDFIHTIAFVLPLFVLRMGLLLRFEVIPPAAGQGWSGYRLTRRQASRRERQSERVDAKLGVWKPIAFALGFIALHVLLAHRPVTLRAGYGCLGERSRGPDYSTNAPKIRVVENLGLASLVVQLAFNMLSPRYSNQKTRKGDARRGSFGGAFKLSTWLVFLHTTALLWLVQVDFVKGHSANWHDVGLDSLIHFVIVASAAVQAAIYPGLPVQQIDNDDEDDD